MPHGFHFPLMPRMYMAIAREDRFPITDIMRQTPDIPEICQWAIFLRNHDELTLEMVTDTERDYLWETYARDRRARINLGIRRRLAPLLERDRRRIELMNTLLLSMPGTPVIYYGDEIGMGDNIHLGDRDGVRTPMQWSYDRNGGFSRADPASLVLPTIMDPLYGFQPSMSKRRGGPAFPPALDAADARRAQEPPGLWSRWAALSLPGNRKVLAYLRETGREGRDHAVRCNLSRAAQAVEVDLPEFRTRAGRIVGGCVFPPIGQLPYLLTLPPYGCFWFALQRFGRAAAVDHRLWWQLWSTTPSSCATILPICSPLGKDTFWNTTYCPITSNSSVGTGIREARSPRSASLRLPRPRNLILS